MHSFSNEIHNQGKQSVMFSEGIFLSCLAIKKFGSHFRKQRLGCDVHAKKVNSRNSEKKYFLSQSPILTMRQLNFPHSKSERINFCSLIKISP